MAVGVTVVAFDENDLGVVFGHPCVQDPERLACRLDGDLVLVMQLLGIAECHRLFLSPTLSRLSLTILLSHINRSFGTFVII